MMNTGNNNPNNIVTLERINSFPKLETEFELISVNKDIKYKTTELQTIRVHPSPRMVIFYCPFNHTYTKLLDYDIDQILALLRNYKKDNFFIIQVDNDDALYQEILSIQFKSEIQNIDKMFDLKLDYCFSPVDDLLCFNLSVLSNLIFDEFDKHLIQILFTRNGLYIINKDGCENILEIFNTKLNFKEKSEDVFFDDALNIKSKDASMINNFNLHSILKNNNDITQIDPIEIHLFERRPSMRDLNNFSTDDLIYWVLTFSLEKLEEFSKSLENEANSLKGIYLELSEKERKDFFRRIHNLEVSMQIIWQESQVKKKFLKYSKSQFKVYNKISNNFYFKNTFNFFVELMISKVTQLEMTFEKINHMIQMIKENYSIMIEDNTEKQNIKLNSVMKVLAIITTIYAPFNVVPSIWGMNVKVPGGESEDMWPFFIIVMCLLVVMLVQLHIFKKLKWF